MLWDWAFSGHNAHESWGSLTHDQCSIFDLNFVHYDTLSWHVGISMNLGDNKSFGDSCVCVCGGWGGGATWHANGMMKQFDFHSHWTCNASHEACCWEPTTSSPMSSPYSSNTSFKIVAHKPSHLENKALTIGLWCLYNVTPHLTIVLFLYPKRTTIWSFKYTNFNLQNLHFTFLDVCRSLFLGCVLRLPFVSCTQASMIILNSRISPLPLSTSN